MKTSITLSDIDALLAASEIDVCTKFGKVTIVTMKLPSGFVLVESSGAVSKENYSEEIGCKTCLDRIAQKLWSLEGYHLSELLCSDLRGISIELSRACFEIEKIPACSEQTAASVLICSLAQRLRDIVNP